MSIKNLFQKILDGYEETVSTDDFDDEPVYTPKSANDDELVDVNRSGVRPVRRPAAPKAAAAPAAAPAEEPKPRFKKVSATRFQAGEQIVALAKEGYIVVVDTSAVEASALLKLRCYLAGAMYALNAHITPVDGNMFVFSVEEFDVQAFVGKNA